MLQTLSNVAGVDATEADIPLQSLPPLPARESRYWYQPFTAVVAVGVLSAALVAATRSTAMDEHLPAVQLRAVLVPLIEACAAVAVICTAFVIFAGAGEVRRSAATCYPIPHAVASRLRLSEGLAGLDNLKGPDGSGTLGTYCVRCLVWRPPVHHPVTGEACKSHHCSICQRCVVGFDHHCDFFGRCIVAANMTCFGLTIGMLWAGLLICAVAFFIWAGGNEEKGVAGGPSAPHRALLFP